MISAQEGIALELRWDIIDFSWPEIMAYLGKNHQTLAYYAIAEDALFVIGISPLALGTGGGAGRRRIGLRLPPFRLRRYNDQQS
ncbi:MAG: hypothetical protein DA408_16515 [Bacteroidetes bacterium]|nr:MAG: hypothetical protein C7N36_00050 [Bacteroidota bacterium]PTM10240.1 MAG: hypothetical protein DA408_16515 [Bacteroidota bacterium]